MIGGNSSAFEVRTEEQGPEAIVVVVLLLAPGVLALGAFAIDSGAPAEVREARAWFGGIALPIGLIGLYGFLIGETGSTLGPDLIKVRYRNHQRNLNYAEVDRSWTSIHTLYRCQFGVTLKTGETVRLGSIRKDDAKRFHEAIASHTRSPQGDAGEPKPGVT